jgi:hypothetical protein
MEFLQTWWMSRLEQQDSCSAQAAGVRIVD